MRVLNQAFDAPLQHEEKAAAPLAGGIMQYGYQCGMIWGAALAAGAQAYRLYGPGAQAETATILSAQKIVDAFRDYKTHIDCFEITQIDRTSTTWQQVSYFLLKGGTIGCFRMAAQYAKIAFDQINSMRAEAPSNPPSSPVGCAALLARKMGASDLHTTMAAGLAGGIGLCGGACGALGAAIWLRGVDRLSQGAGKIGFKDADTLVTIDRFLKCTDYKFKCAEIVGREFTNVSDHAGYVSDGGCAVIIDALGNNADGGRR